MENLAGPSFPRSSLLLQGMIWLEDWVTMLLVSVVLVLLICKPFLYRYPPGLAASEFILMLCHVPVQAARSWLGTAGNKQERAMFVAAFLGLSSWTILVTGYFFLLQAYALYLESILAGTALALALFETLQGAKIMASLHAQQIEMLVACTCNCFSSVGMLLFNKLAVQALPLECSLVWLQLFFAAFFMLIFGFPYLHIGSMRDFLRWCMVVPCFCGMLLTSILALNLSTSSK
eukprot:s259_g14.t1